MTDPTPRRVTMAVTGYLTHSHPAAGWYDMQAQADGGQTFSIPEFAVNEASITDAPPETLTDNDWSEIEGHVAARFGTDRAAGILAQWRSIADVASLPWTEAVDGHPGETLRRRLEQLAMPQAELARRTGLSGKHINQIIQGVTGISPKVAITLERETGVPSTVWRRLDGAWRDRQARENAERPKAVGE